MREQATISTSRHYPIYKNLVVCFFFFFFLLAFSSNIVDLQEIQSVNYMYTCTYTTSPFSFFHLATNLPIISKTFSCLAIELHSALYAGAVVDLSTLPSLSTSCSKIRKISICHVSNQHIYTTYISFHLPIPLFPPSPSVPLASFV